MQARPLRTVSLTAAAAVAGASLTMLAAPAADAAAPAGSDIVGTALINGGATAGVRVTLYGATPGSAVYTDLSSITTDATGSYGFDLAGYSTYTTFKLEYNDVRTIPVGDGLRAKGFFYGPAPTLKRGTAFPAADGTVFTVPTQSLALQAGIKGTIAVPVPPGYTYSGEVDAYDSDDNYVGYSSFDSSPTNDATDPDGQVTYLLRNLDPDQSYKLQVYAYAYNATTGDSISYISHFIGGGSQFDSATEYTVGGPGSILQPVNSSVTNVLSASEAPSIVGQVAPGKTLGVDNGSWSVNAGTTYTYQWLVNDVQVSTAPTYAPSKADLGKKLRVLVTARNDDFVGQASTETDKVGYAAKLKAKAKKAVVKGKTVVEVVGRLKVTGVKKNKLAQVAQGKIVVTELNAAGDEVKVGKGKVKRGKLLVVLKGVTAGKHVFTVSFEGKKVASVEKDVKVKV